MFLDCGGLDQVWDSCPYAQAIMTRLGAHHDRYRHLLYPYPAAGHGIGDSVPYQPGSGAATSGELSGGSADANPDADAKIWPLLLQFLAQVAVTR